MNSVRVPTARLLLDVACSERDFQRALMELARLTGWRMYHARPAQYRRGGWATPLAGDAGLPDLILCKPPRLIFAELKSARGRLSPAQAQWMDALRACGVEVYLWRPSDWQEIVATLTEP